MKVAIIDYGLCNLFSVVHACKHVGLDAVITSDADEIFSAPAAILPGVGAFASAMDCIKERKLDQVINDFIKTKKPFMGICLGLHLLFDYSEEFGNTKGLSIIPGVVKKVPKGNGPVPQISWNTVEIQKDTEILEGIRDKEFMYFVHSFYVEPKKEEDILTLTQYGGLKYCSSIQRENVVAFQFHPEKSAVEGLKIYQNFKNMMC